MLMLFLLSVMVISLSGVMMPGPVFAVTIAKGFKSSLAGVLVSLGHGIIEFPLMFLIYFGFGEFFKLSPVKTVVGLVGGMILIYLGINMIKVRVIIEGEGRDLPYNSIMAGIITTFFNPYFFLWWATIGTALIMKSLAFRFIGFTLFAITHWLCDLGWYAFVSLAVHRTQHLWSRRLHRIVFSGCGSILLGFGGWFIWSAIA